MKTMLVAAAVLLLGSFGDAAAVFDGEGTTRRYPDCPYRTAKTRSYEKRAASSWVNRGCVQDGGARLLSTQVYSGNLNTPDYCTNLCKSKNFKYAGVQYGQQCWCGNSLDNGMGATLDNSKCNMACSGNAGLKCGAAYTMNLYERPASLGCYEDYSTRVLPFRANAGTVTRGSCISACATANYKFAGVQNGGECWCGNNQPTVKKDGCNVACAGDKSETCGGVWRLDVFSTGKSGGGGTTTPPPPAHSGLAPIASNAATNAQVLTAGPPAASGAKQVWAHHMVGNTYSYKQANWLADINQAKAAGLDGFALNMGRDPWQPQSVAWAYAAAQQAGGFKLFFSFDMTSFGCANDNDANTIANLIKKYATHPAQAYYQNRVLVSTFAGENCNFGKGNVQAGWSGVKSKSGVNYFFIPSTFMTPANIQSQQWFDGQMNWDAAWPNSASDLTLDRDNQWMSALGSRKYMASLSPFFFTYYGPNSWNKNWIYRSDNWLLATRFEQLISIRSKIDMIELITWNDYGESHYIGGIGADQPNSQGWTNNMPHTPKTIFPPSTALPDAPFLIPNPLDIP